MFNDTRVIALTTFPGKEGRTGSFSPLTLYSFLASRGDRVGFDTRRDASALAASEFAASNRVTNLRGLGSSLLH